MSKRLERLEVPADLEHLIEKRGEENERRGTGRRTSGRGKSPAASAAHEKRKTDRRRKGRRKNES